MPQASYTIQVQVFLGLDMLLVSEIFTELLVLRPFYRVVTP